MNNDRAFKTNWALNLWEFVGVFGGAIFLLLSKQGFVYLTHNQTQYFIYAMRLAQPHFIPNDWFTWQTFHHDFAFGYLIYILSKIGPLFITAIVMDFLLLASMAYSLLILCRRFCVYPFVVYILLLTWLGIISANEIGLGWQYLFCGFLQPSEVSGCLMVVGMSLLFERQFVFSGTVLGLAGLFHGAYLVSFGPAIIATALAVGVWRNWRSLFSFGLPLVLLWGLLAVVVGQALAHSSGPTQQTMSIMTNLRAPGDFIVSQWPLDWMVNWFIWAFLGLFVMADLGPDQKYKEMRVCFFALLLTSLAGIAQAIFIKNQSLVLLMLWRSSPVALILGQVIVLDRSVNLLMNPQRVKNADKIFTCVLIAAVLILLNNHWGLESNRRFMWLLAFPLAAGGCWITRVLGKSHAMQNKVITVLLMSVMMAVMVKTSYGGLKLSHNFETHPESVSLGNMEQWVKKNTPADSIFIVAPGMEYMRIRARRAIVVDATSSCYLPSDLQQWYQRLCAISGLPSKPLVPDFHALANGYNQLDTARAKRLKDLYGAQYVVILSYEHKGDVSGLIERYANADYRVLEIP